MSPFRCILNSILQCYWSSIISWEWFRISSKTMLFHLFIAKIISFSSMTMYLDFKDAIAFASFLEIIVYAFFIANDIDIFDNDSFNLLDINFFEYLYWQRSFWTFIPPLIQFVIFFSSISSLTIDVLRSAVCSFISFIF